MNFGQTSQCGKAIASFYGLINTMYCTNIRWVTNSTKGMWIIANWQAHSRVTQVTSETQIRYAFFTCTMAELKVKSSKIISEQIEFYQAERFRLFFFSNFDVLGGNKCLYLTRILSENVSYVHVILFSQKFSEFIYLDSRIYSVILGT